jgi:hypothetical protein
MEIDAMGHIQKEEDVLETLRILWDRIQDFKAKHPERRFQFTIFSDHGIDFIPVEPDRLVEINAEMPKVGIKVVESLKGRDPSKEIYAVPIEHVRLTYLSLHTDSTLRTEVASRLSQLPFVDIAVAKVPPPQGKEDLEWYGLWSEGKQEMVFGFNPKDNTYVLSEKNNYDRFDLPIPSFQDSLTFKDSALFEQNKNGKYPDLFYRIRTALSPVGVQYPADVLASFKSGYVAIGFVLPGGDKTFSLNGFHGSLRDSGSLGTLLTEERDLPTAVRSDTILELFPKLRENIENKGVKIHPGDPNSFLPY